MKELTSIHDFGPFLKKQKLLDIFAEVGVAEGRSSLEFMKWGFKKCILVDRWEYTNVPGDSSQPQAWHDNNLMAVKERIVNKYPKKVRILKGDSVAMAEKNNTAACTP